MIVHLLDANVLVALVTYEHEHHEVVTRWAGGLDRFAVCPVVQGAFVRYAVRLGIPSAQITQTLRQVEVRRGYEFWPDDLSYAEASLDVVRGHRQVTDAYLVSLVAARPDASVATMDAAMARTWPERTTLVGSRTD